jgi:cell division protein ZapA
MGNARLEVTVLGQRLSLKGACDAAHVQRLAHHVDQKVEAIRRGGSTLSTLKLAVLAALNLADDCLAAQRSEQDFRDDMLQRSKALLTALDELEGREASDRLRAEPSAQLRAKPTAPTSAQSVRP